MKKISTFLSALFLFGAYTGNAQVFWTENFDGGSTGLQVSSYTSTIGPWTLTANASSSYSTEATYPNPWYVSCEEAGHVAGECGTTCATGAGLGSSLHIGSDAAVLGDMGASYFSGGACAGSSSSSSSSLPLLCITTNRRAESPTINCTGKSNILLKFYYIEGGDGSIDDGSVWYYDGTTWSLLVNTPKTTTCGVGGQGLWAVDTITLPASANNNPNVKIGFFWANNDDAFGTDPSFAIDSISLSTESAPVASFSGTASTACQDSCITFTSTSTGAPTAFSWSTSPSGPTIATPAGSSTAICFPVAGTYSVTLTASNGTGSSSSTTLINVSPTPHPVITQSGSTLSVPTGYTTYQWYSGISAITGATTNTYITPAPGLYGILVDSAGCAGFDTLTVSTLHANTVKNTSSLFQVTQLSGNTISINSTKSVSETITVSLFDITGRKIIEEQWSTGTNVKEINISELASAQYLIQLRNQTTSVTLKWVKQ